MYVSINRHRKIKGAEVSKLQCASFFLICHLVNFLTPCCERVLTYGEVAWLLQWRKHAVCQLNLMTWANVALWFL